MIVIDQVYTQSYSGVASGSSPLTISSQEAVLLVLITFDDSTALGTNPVTFNNDPLTQIAGLANGSFTSAYAFYTPNPPVGTYQLSVTVPSANGLRVVALSLLGVDKKPTNPLTNTGTSAAASLVLSLGVTAPNSILLSAVDSLNGGAVQNETPIGTGVSYNYVGPGIQTLTWTEGASDTWVGVIVALEPANANSIWSPATSSRYKNDTSLGRLPATGVYGRNPSTFFQNSFLHTIGRMLNPPPPGGGFAPNVSDSSTVTESVTVTISSPAINVFDSSAVTENIAIAIADPVSVFDSSAVTESVTVEIVYLVNVFDSSNVAETFGYSMDNASGAGYVDIPYASAFQPTTSTVAMWAWHPNWGSVTATQVFWGDAFGGGFIMDLNDTPSDGNFSLFFHIGSSYTQLTYPISSITAGWHRFVGTYDGTTMNLYIDNVKQATTSVSGSITYGGHTPDIMMFVNPNAASGNTPGASFFTGRLKQPEFYNTAWLASDVSNDWNSGKGYVKPSSSQSGLVAGWNTNDGTGTTIADYSGNAHTGTFFGTTQPTWVQVSPITGESHINIGLAVNVFDSSTVTENLTMNVPVNINVFDSSTVTESITITTGTLPVNVFDSSTVTESVTMLIIDFVNVNDSSTVTESITPEIIYSINVFDSSTVTDVITQVLQIYLPNVSDSSTVTESVTMLITDFISVNDASTVTENTTVVKVDLINVFDSSAVIEAITVVPGIIVFDNASSSGYEASLSTYSWSHTATGNHLGVIVGVSIFAAGTVSSVTYNGVNLTFVRADANGIYRSEIWELEGIPAGTNTIQVNLSTSLTSIANAVTYQNVDQKNQIVTSTGNNNIGDPASTTINTTEINAWTVDNVATKTTGIAPTATGQRSRANNTGALGTGAMSDKGTFLTPGNTTMSWSTIGTLDSWAQSVIALRPYGDIDVIVNDSSTVTESITVEIVDLEVIFDSSAVTESVTAEIIYCINAFDSSVVTDPMDYALKFDGSQNYVEATPTTPASISGNWSVGMQVNPGSLSALNNTFFSTRTVGHDFTFDVKFKNNTAIHADIGNGSGWLSTGADYNFTPVVGTTYHVVYVVTATGYTIYVNGSNVANGTWTSDVPLLYDSTRKLDIGSNQHDAEYLTGTADNVVIYNRALNSTEVSNWANSNLIPSNPSLEYLMNEGSGTTTADAANGNTGTLKGTPTPSWVIGLTQPTEKVVITNNINVFDSSAVTESVTMLITDFINVNDASSVTDVPTVVQVYLINVNDSSTVTESITAIQGYCPNVFDSSTVTDVITQILITDFINVFDSSTVTESVTLNVPINISVFDSSAVTESIVVEEIDNESVFDSSAVTESITVEIVYLINISDSSTVTESLTIEQIYLINVFDSSAVTENLTILTSGTDFISVFDSSTITENITVEQIYLINVGEDSAVTESLTISAPLAGITVFDSSAVTESITVEIVDIEVINDTSTVTDVITQILLTDNISIGEDSAVTENIVVEIIEEEVIFDASTVTESITVEIVYCVVVNDSSTVTESVKMLLTDFISVFDSSSVVDVLNGQNGGIYLNPIDIVVYDVINGPYLIIFVDGRPAIRLVANFYTFI